MDSWSVEQASAIRGVFFRATMSQRWEKYSRQCVNMEISSGSGKNAKAWWKHASISFNISMDSLEWRSIEAHSCMWKVEKISLAFSIRSSEIIHHFSQGKYRATIPRVRWLSGSVEVISPMDKILNDRRDGEVSWCLHLRSDFWYASRGMLRK